jgi:Lon protease-like protein
MEEETLEIPIFPLNTVLFPGGRLPLRIFEVRYVDMTKACIRDDGVFGVCQILDGKEVGTPALSAPVGCTARIVDWDVPSPGLFNLICGGERVFRVLDQHVQPDGLIRAEVVLEAPREPRMLPPTHKMLGSMLGEILQKIGVEHFEQPAKLEDAQWVGYRLAEILPLSRDQKILLLQERDPWTVLEQIQQAVLDLPGG